MVVTIDREGSSEDRLLLISGAKFSQSGVLNMLKMVEAAGSELCGAVQPYSTMHSHFRNMVMIEL